MRSTQSSRRRSRGGSRSPPLRIDRTSSGLPVSGPLSRRPRSRKCAPPSPCSWCRARPLRIPRRERRWWGKEAPYVATPTCPGTPSRRRSRTGTPPLATGTRRGKVMGTGTPGPTGRGSYAERGPHHSSTAASPRHGGDPSHGPLSEHAPLHRPAPLARGERHRGCLSPASSKPGPCGSRGAHASSREGGLLMYPSRHGAQLLDAGTSLGV